jgi:hypothetical protein
MKMEIHFAKVMARSEELYKQKLRARKIINRLTREKSRILDTLAGLESEHLKLKDDDDFENGKTSNNNNSSSNNKQYSIFPEKADIFTDERIWNDDVKYLAQMQSESYEFSSDEENDPAPRNPMSLIEWLRRNQPSVFTIDSGSGADGKPGADATPATAAGGSGTGSSGAAGSKKRKANSTDAGAGNKPGRKRKVTAAAAAPAASSVSAPSPDTTTRPTADPAIVASAAENGAAVMGDEGASSTVPSDPSNGSLAPVKPVKAEE